MPNLEWEVAHTLETPEGDLHFNVVETSPSTQRLWQIQPSDYKIVPTLRVTSDDLSQADGSVLHPRWKTGLVATMTVNYLIAVGDGPEYIPACGQDLREMHETLILHLNAIRNLGEETSRLLWTPTGLSGARRMLTDVQVLAWPDPSRDGIEYGVTFSLETPFPYAIDLTEAQDTITDGGSETITNGGNADFFLVARVDGPTTVFSVVNSTTGLSVEYDGNRDGAVSIGATDYVEIDFFRGTAFLNGDGADLIAGIDPTLTDFFPLVPGPNVIELDGADALILSNGAWA